MSQYMSPGMSPARFHALLGVMIDDNPLAVRALLRILSVVFTDTVPTLAVTLEAKPRLLVNLDFINAHCKDDEQVKAVILHEFLHVLLRHTERFTPGDLAQHLAFDAVINAIIHRSMGTAYSDMMATFYADVPWPWKLLRPPREPERYGEGSRYYLTQPWKALYDGKLCADDLEALARQLRPRSQKLPKLMIGGHEALPASGSAKFSTQSQTAILCESAADHNSPREVASQPATHSPIASASPALAEALERALRAMNGHGIWRGPRPGVGAYRCSLRSAAASRPLQQWRHQTREILARHLQPDTQGAREWVADEAAQLPVLHAGDRRGFARALWSPLLPAVSWPSAQKQPIGTAHVYLDVSGSMYSEMAEIIALLASLGRYVRRPFWAFSDSVVPARIRGGVLETDTSGGTSMACVLHHLRRHRPPAAVVVTDGYIEALEPALVRSALKHTRLHTLVTRSGGTQALRAAGIAYTQLGGLPE
jgi:hypothetical protein